MQVYPDGGAGDLTRFLRTENMAYSSSRHHYGAWMLVQYLVDRNGGVGMFNRMWNEAKSTEHPLETYRRIAGLTQAQLNAQLAEYAQHQVTYDYSNKSHFQTFINNVYGAGFINAYNGIAVDAVNQAAGHYTVPDAIAPSDYGYNKIKLVPELGRCADQAALQGPREQRRRLRLELRLRSGEERHPALRPGVDRGGRPDRVPDPGRRERGLPGGAGRAGVGPPLRLPRRLHQELPLPVRVRRHRRGAVRLRARLREADRDRRRPLALQRRRLGERLGHRRRHRVRGSAGRRLRQQHGQRQRPHRGPGLGQLRRHGQRQRRGQGQRAGPGRGQPVRQRSWSAATPSSASPAPPAPTCCSTPTAGATARPARRTSTRPSPGSPTPTWP